MNPWAVFCHPFSKSAERLGIFVQWRGWVGGREDACSWACGLLPMAYGRLPEDVGYSMR
jgi:hypothetical protein